MDAALIGGIVPALLPVITPLLIAGIKLVITKLPTWSLPVIAPLLAGVLDAVNAYFTGVSIGPLQAGLLGLAGVGVREVVDQAKHRIAT